MSERDIQKAIIDYLQLLENLGKLIFIRNNSIAATIVRPNGSRGYVNNKKPGSPDILVFGKDGRTFHLEVKAEKGRQSPAQKDYEKNIKKLGHQYKVVRSINDVQHIIETYL